MIRDDLLWLTWTIFMEAAGESYQGKLAVGWVVMNRYKKRPAPIAAIVMKPYQFSCWNTYSPTRKSLVIDELSPTWKDCFKAAAASYFNLVPDPTAGCTHYLNPRALASLPVWYAKSKVRVVIGNHEFLEVP